MGAVTRSGDGVRSSSGRRLTGEDIGRECDDRSCSAALGPGGDAGGKLGFARKRAGRAGHRRPMARHGRLAAGRPHPGAARLPRRGRHAQREDRELQPEPRQSRRRHRDQRGRRPPRVAGRGDRRVLRRRLGRSRAAMEGHVQPGRRDAARPGARSPSRAAGRRRTRRRVGRHDRAERRPPAPGPERAHPRAGHGRALQLARPARERHSGDGPGARRPGGRLRRVSRHAQVRRHAVRRRHPDCRHLDRAQPARRDDDLHPCDRGADRRASRFPTRPRKWLSTIRRFPTSASPAR